MFLIVDAGNTRIKWGLRKPGSWQQQGSCAHHALTEIDVLLQHHTDVLQGVLICNVAGQAVADRLQDLCAAHNLPLSTFSSTAQACGVRNGYREAGRLGADRWASLLAARQRFPGRALLTINAGTATTVDALDADGGFLGGLILPGLDAMRRALATGTANLPYAQGQVSGFPASTEDAILSGCVDAQLGAIERMYARLAAHVASAAAPAQAHAPPHPPRDESGPALCLISGGAAGSLLPHLQLPSVSIENLVLDGLACWLEHSERAAFGLRRK